MRLTTEAGEIYNAECTTLWKELRLDATQVTNDHIHATVKKNKASSAAMQEELRLRSSVSAKALQKGVQLLKEENKYE